MNKINHEAIGSRWEEGWVFLGGIDNLCFFPVSKNANGSIRTIFNLTKMTIFKENMMDFIKFAVIRDPLERIVSSYTEILKLRKDSNIMYTKSLSFFNISSEPERFTQFLEDIKEDSYDTHVLPQVYQMYKPELIDYFVLFEIFQKDLGRFIKEYNIKTSAPLSTRRQVNMQPNLQTDLIRFIKENEQIANKIRDIYPEDFDLYTEIRSQKEDML